MARTSSGATAQEAEGLFVHVNGARLYFDVEGCGLVPDGARMREKPTLLLLHGGPGADHCLYKPAFSAFADVAQVVYLDHRGNGRSERGDANQWNLAQWADDVATFCDTLGLVQPIVYGASFGGMVAMAYAARHPGHAGALALVSTACDMTSHSQAKVDMFTRLGGPQAGALARRRFQERDTCPEVMAAWLELALPLYTRRPPEPGAWRRGRSFADVTAWFNRPGGEGQTMNLRPGLANIQCPTLVLGGVLDPMLPIECQRDIAAALPQGICQYQEFPDAGHGVVHDEPLAATAVIRNFIQAQVGRLCNPA